MLLVDLPLLGAESENAASSALCDLGNFHRRFREGKSVIKTGNSLVIDALLVACIKRLTSDLGGGGDNETAKFLLELGSHGGALGFGGFLRLVENVLGGSDGLLRFFLGERGRTFLGFADETLGIRVGFLKEGCFFFLAVCKLLLDLLQFGLTIGDASAAFVEDLLDRFEGELFQHKEHEDEVNELGNKERPVHSVGCEETLLGSGGCEDRDHCEER